MEKIARIATAAAFGLCCLNGCQKNGIGTETGKLCLGFAEPSVTAEADADTRAPAPYDTNAFILTITDWNGNTIYDGTYGAKPSEITLNGGTYEIDVVSDVSNGPAFERPVYGDHQIAVISGGKTANVSLMCRLVNSAIRLSFTESFKKKYPSGKISLKQESGSLEYAFDEERAAYFEPGNVSFAYMEEGETPLFNRVVEAGNLYRLTLNASCNESDAGFSINVDDSVTEKDEIITVGDESWKNADGSSKEKALDVLSAASRPGDTVWVWGYIIGGDLTATGITFDGPFLKSSNMAIAKSVGDRNREKCFSVELSKTSVKEALNLVSHPENLGRKVWLYGVVSDYFSMPGLKKVTDFAIDDI